MPKKSISRKDGIKEITKLEREQIQLEKQQLQEQKKMQVLEKRQLEELAKLEKLEKEIRSEVRPHPLRDITYRDLIKATIGSIVGMVAHFTFIEGVHIAETITIARASILYLLSFFLGGSLLYLTGFRKVKQKLVLKILPLRLTVIYLTALVWIVLVLFTFGIVDLTTQFNEIYKQVAVISIIAVIGASAADLIGE
ncbi:MAG: DUF2391 family protein [Candidatus Nanoarchaeia archaeon]|nr:DUF2391 family protein [Candidatus Nanoarchaeia archaeon]